MTRKKSIKVEIPWSLHIAIIKLQGNMESSYDEACNKASQLLDVNSKEFEKALEAKNRSMEKSQLMIKINKSKKTWTDKGYNKGYGEGHRQRYKKGVTEYKITYPCSICGKELVMMPREKDHATMKSMMRSKGWAHLTCLKAN